MARNTSSAVACPAGRNGTELFGTVRPSAVGVRMPPLQTGRHLARRPAAAAFAWDSATPSREPASALGHSVGWRSRRVRGSGQQLASRRVAWRARPPAPGLCSPNRAPDWDFVLFQKKKDWDFAMILIRVEKVTVKHHGSGIFIAIWLQQFCVSRAICDLPGFYS